MKSKKKAQASRGHYGTIHWYNLDYWLLNGLLLPGMAHTALCELVNSRRFPDVDSAICEGIRIVLQENSPLLIRLDRKWIHMLSDMNTAFKDPARAKPDGAGEENVRFLNQMYESIRKAEEEVKPE